MVRRWGGTRIFEEHGGDSLKAEDASTDAAMECFPWSRGAISVRVNTVTFINLRDGEMEFYMQGSVAMAN